MMEETKRGDTVKIESIANGNLRIWLAEDEIEEWGLQGEGEDGVRRLVRRALAAVGRRHTARVWAEMIPVEGGCVLLVSPTVHRHRLPAIFSVTAEALAEIYVRWRGERAQIYTVEDEYRIVSYSEDEYLLCEYGTLWGRGEIAAAHTAEYGRWVGEITAPVPALPEHEDRER